MTKVVLLAGGAGTRLAEETEVRPKPMVEVGGMPLLWHIMRHYAVHGFDDFVVALGYKGDYVKRWWADYAQLGGDLTIAPARGTVEAARGNQLPDWRVELVDTGHETGTGGRVRRLASRLDETFLLTWGDGVSDVDLTRLVAYHRSHGKLATVTAVRPPARYGHLVFDGDRVAEFSEKPQTAEGWINGAFFVLEPGALDFVDDDATMFEHAPLERLALAGELMAWRHEGFWQCMDTLREKHVLEELWRSGHAPWKTWD